MSTGVAPGPPIPKLWDPSHAAAATRTMRGDTRKNEMQSLLFPDRPNQAAHVPVPASQVASYGTSINHPFANVGERPPEVASRLQPANVMRAQKQHHAGRPAPRGEDVHGILMGREPESAPPVAGRRAAPRTQYEHPTYRIGRDLRGSAAKDALYGEPQQQPPQQPEEEEDAGRPAAPTTD